MITNTITHHVLPKGFHKIRYYGLLSPVKRDLLQRIKRLLVHRTAFDVILNTQIETSQSEQVEPTNPKVLHCKRCGGLLILVMKIYPYQQRAPPIFIRCLKKKIPAWSQKQDCILILSGIGMPFFSLFAPYSHRLGWITFLKKWFYCKKETF